MLSVFSIKASTAKGLANYYESLASADDYFEKGDESEGIWRGAGSEKVGVSGKIKQGELLNAMRGYSPQTEKPMANNAGDTHKVGWDATFSAPKSVSAIWAIANEKERESISEAHSSAVDAALDYIEREAISTRTGQRGIYRQAVIDSGGLIIASYEHSTSRNKDPQLHTHNLIMNMNKDGRGLEFDTKHKMAAGALYRTELASQLQSLGFQTERDVDSFKIVGVDKSLIKQWSSRRDEITNELEEKGLSGAKASAVAALNTRSDKSSEPRKEFFNRWAEEAKEYGMTADSVKELQQLEVAINKPEMKTSAEIMETLTAQRSTVSEVQIRAAVAVESQSFLNAKESEQFTLDLLASEHVIELGEKKDKYAEYSKSGTRYTTQYVLDIESEMLTLAIAMDGNKSHQIRGHILERSLESNSTLTAEQKLAVEYLTQQSGQIAVMQGRAGSGKSFTLGTVREVYESEGYTVVGTAVSNSATKNIQSEAGIKSINTTLLEIEIENGRTNLNEKTILIVDEAGMQSTRQTASLLQRVEEAGSKIILVGDTKQLQAIESGAPMRLIAEKIGQTELTTSKRQKTERGIKIATAFREGHPETALMMLKDDGNYHISKDMTRAAQAAATAYIKDVGAGKESIVVAATRREVGMLNGAIRLEMKEKGQLPEKGLNVSTSKGRREFSKGDRIVFGKRFDFGGKGDDDKSVWNGAIGIITDTENEQLQVDLVHSGERVNIDLNEMNQIDHAYAVTVHKSQGLSVDTTHVLAGNNTGMVICGWFTP